MDKECYQSVLEINKNATENEIKKAYQKLAREQHPDKNTNLDQDLIKSREEKFKLVSEAYEILSNEQTRATQDKFGHDGFKNYEFADAQDIMENFIVGGEVFEKQIGKSMIEEVEDINKNEIEDVEQQRDLAIIHLYENYKALLESMQENKTQTVIALIKDSVLICSLPANKHILKQLGQLIQNQANRMASDRSFLDKCKSQGYSVQNMASQSSNLTGLISRSLMVQMSIQPELKELKEFEMLDEEERMNKKDDISQKIMNKFKKNEQRFIEITKSMHIILIHSKMTKVLEKLFQNEDDPKIRWQYIDSLIIIGSIFMNQYDKNIQAGIDLENHDIFDEFTEKQKRLYQELPQSNDPKNDFVKLNCYKYNPKNFNFMNRIQLFFNNDKYICWIMFKKTKIEWQNQGNEAISKKLFYKDINQLEKTDKGYELCFDSGNEIRILEYVDSSNKHLICEYIKYHKININSKKTYQKLQKMNDNNKNKQQNCPNDENKGILMIRD